MDKVAIVILNFNGKHYLEQFLQLVVLHSPGCQVIVADNGSTDDSVSFLQESYPSVRLIMLRKNYGFSTGYNLALRQVDASYYVLLNSDVEVTPHWIDPVIQLMDEQQTIAACQPKILSYHQKHTLEYAGAAGGYIDILGYPFCRGRIFNTVEEDHPKFDDLREVFWATGACMFVRSDVYHQLGGLDDDFFAHMEEIDLCWRMHHAGYRVFYQGKSQVYHVGGGTLPKSNPRKTYLNFRNGLIMLFKNMTYRELTWKLPLRLLLDYLAAFQYLLQGKGKNFCSILHAQISFFSIIGKLFAKRKRNEKNNEKFTFGIYPGFIVKDYFLKKKKYFDDLRF